MFLTLTDSFRDVCRLCLINSQPLKSVFDIQENTTNKHDIANKISVCLNVKIKEEDQFSKQICETCLNNVEKFHEFWNNSNNAQEILKQLANSFQKQLGEDVKLKEAEKESDIVKKSEQNSLQKTNYTDVKQKTFTVNSNPILINSKPITRKMGSLTIRSTTQLTNHLSNNLQKPLSINDSSAILINQQEPNNKKGAIEIPPLIQSTNQSSNLVQKPFSINANSIFINRHTPASENSSLVIHPSTQSINQPTNIIQKSCVGDLTNTIVINHQSSSNKKDQQAIVDQTSNLQIPIAINTNPVLINSQVPQNNIGSIVEQTSHYLKKQFPCKTNPISMGSQLANGKALRPIQHCTQSINRPFDVVQKPFVNTDHHVHNQPLVINETSMVQTSKPNSKPVFILVRNNSQNTKDTTEPSKISDTSKPLQLNVTQPQQITIIAQVPNNSNNSMQLQQINIVPENKISSNNQNHFLQNIVKACKTAPSSSSSNQSSGNFDLPQKKYKQATFTIRNRFLGVKEVNEFKCEFCDKSYTFKCKLDEHRRKHTGERPFKCDIEGCNKRFKTKSCCQVHKLSAHSNERPYVCNICDKTFKQKLGLTDHKKTHGERTLHCDLCGYSTFYKALLDAHKKRHKDRYTYVCDYCDKGFFQKHDIDNHYKTVHDKMYTCNNCDEYFTDPLKLKLHKNEKHKIIKLNDGPIICNICNKVFCRKGTLKMHIKRDHQGLRYNCFHCGREVKSRSAIMQHLRKHSGEKPFKCLICKKRFISATILRMHQVVHTRLKRYVCTICDKSYSQRSSLNIHSKKCHPQYEIKSLKCDKCGIITSTELSYQMHLENVHNNKHRYQCYECGIKVKNKSLIIIHLRKHNGNKPYECNDCKQCFISRKELKLHQFKHIALIKTEEHFEHSSFDSFVDPDMSFVIKEEIDYDVTEIKEEIVYEPMMKQEF